MMLKLKGGMHTGSTGHSIMNLQLSLRAPTRRRSQIALLVGLAFLVAGLVWGLSLVLPPAVDWHTAFRPAALSLLAGRSPYEVAGFFNPAWALLPLMPMAMLPVAVGRAALFLVSLLALLYIAHRLGARLPAVLLLLLSPPAIHGLLNGNIDWLALLGLVVPARWGLFFFAIKPQIGAALALFLLLDAWRDGGWRQVVSVAWPVTATTLLSLLLFGFWPARSAVEVDLWWNASLWPGSIPVGLALMFIAGRKGDIRFAMGAAPCLSPYVLLHSWITALFALVTSLPALAMAVGGLWLLVLFQALR
jgi:hypothetical protein